ncbi:MAG: SH3 domain-containing protein [Bacteroidetes bacterium]|nr:SH3 domain-containing protein [Bacteroidota bacterium]
MGRHFNYEINENKLKIRLKNDLKATPINAWRNFYSSTTHQHKKHTNFSHKNNVTINFSKKVVLPIVFCCIIVGFIFMLYNFVNFNKVLAKNSNSLNQVQTQTPTIQSKTIITTVPIKSIAQKTDSVKKTEALTEIRKKEINDSIEKTEASKKQVSLDAKVETAILPLKEDTQNKNIVTIKPDVLYSEPNIKSPSVGKIALSKKINIIETTNYFYKVAINENGTMLTGYLLKTSTNNALTTYPAAQKSKERKALVIEPIQSQTIINTSENEKEIELR